MGGAMHSPPRIRLVPRPSRLACAFLAIACAATAALIAVLPLTPLASITAWVVVAAIAARGLRRCAGRGGPALLHVGIDRRVTVTGRDGRSRDGTVRDDSYVGAAITVIVWRPDRARWWQPSEAVPILPDALQPDEFRRLRVLLRYGRAPAEGGTSGVDAS
jgi:toxin CptA